MSFHPMFTPDFVVLGTRQSGTQGGAVLSATAGAGPWISVDHCSRLSVRVYWNAGTTTGTVQLQAATTPTSQASPFLVDTIPFNANADGSETRTYALESYAFVRYNISVTVAGGGSPGVTGYLQGYQ